MKSEIWLEDSLRDLREQHLERSLHTISDPSHLNFSTNDYLNLARDPRVLASAAKALHQYGAGARASRLLAGALPIHEELERRLASYKGYPSALLFGSGYMTNAGVIPALVGPDDHIFADRLCHASLLDAAVLSRARIHRFRHNDAFHLEEMLRHAPPKGRRLIVTESVFSMDGDLAPLPAIADLAERHACMLMVDEAHATGVFGPRGRGCIAAHQLQSHVGLSMCTLSKALGGYGGAVACSSPMRQWLINKARAFIYTTAPNPAAVGAALGALEVIEGEPHLGDELLRRATTFRERLNAAGFDTLKSESQIVPLLVGANDKVVALSQRLREEGIVAAAIRPPTVPRGTARIRLSVTLGHNEEDLDRAAGILIRCANAAGLP
jgi:8-amino-7-oxononanoate synthase